MEDLKNNPQQETDVQINNTLEEAPQKEDAGWLGIGASFLFPLIGIIIYFSQRDEVNNPSAYLWGAFAGFAAGLIIRLITA